MDRIYLCIDLKTFYASVECVERGLDPFYTNLVVADPSRGRGAICLAISPSMKSHGIRNRCRIFEIPDNVKYITAKPRMSKYIEYSANIYAIYLKYVDKDDIHVYSIDEAFLDVTRYLNLYKVTPLELSKKIMSDIYNSYGITATCGIGTNLYLAKIALDITAKHVSSNIGYLDEDKYIKELGNYTKLTDFWSIGPGIEKRLHKLNLYTMNDISNCDELVLYKEFGINAKLLIDHSKGIETCTISDIKKYKPKSNSISSSQILFENYSYTNARLVLKEMVDNLVLELIGRNMYTKSIHLGIGYTDDIIPSTGGSKKLEVSTNQYSILLNNMLSLFDKTTDKDELIRRIYISFGTLSCDSSRQLDLFHNFNDNKKEEKLERTINSIKNKYGKNSILRAISYQDKATGRLRNKLIGGHNAY